MRIFGECARARGRVVLSTFAVLVVVMTAGAMAASAQVTLPTPGTVETSQLLDDVLPDTSPLPTPSLTLPSTPVDELLPGQLNDTIKELPVIGGGTEVEPGSGTTPGSGGSTGAPKPSGGSSSTGSTNAGTTGGATGGTSVNAPGSSEGAPRDGVAARAPYASTAGRAAATALSRALRLSGPFAAPILMAILALGVLIAVGRGSDRLVKVERLTGYRETYRL